MIRFEREKVRLNNTLQDIMIMSDGNDRPILLILHGGPGSPDRAEIKKFNFGLASDFTVVCWDQRGSGYSNTKECKKLPLTMDLLLSDLDCLVDYLRNKFKKEKIYISGHSFGTNLGVRYVLAHSEKIGGYVGTGQYVSDKRSKAPHYEFTYEQAKKHHNKRAVKRLEKIGHPDSPGYVADAKKEAYVRALSQKYGSYCYNGKNYGPYIPLYIKEYKKDIFKLIGGIVYSLKSPAEKEIAESECIYESIDFTVPIVIISGETDYVCSISTAKEWFGRINAPAKKFIEIPKAGHMACFEQPEKWNKAVRSILEMSE